MVYCQPRALEIMGSSPIVPTNSAPAAGRPDGNP